MSCALTQGYTLGCRDSVGGIPEVRFIEFQNVTGVAVSSGNVVTGITTSGSTKFWKYELPKQTSQFTETVNPSTENGTIFYQQDLQIVLNKMTAALRNELRLLGQNRLMAIVTDRNYENPVDYIQKVRYLPKELTPKPGYINYDNTCAYWKSNSID